MGKPSCINPGKGLCQSLQKTGAGQFVKVQNAGRGKRPCHSFENSGRGQKSDLCWEEDPREQTECTILLGSEGSVLKGNDGVVLVYCEPEE